MRNTPLRSLFRNSLAALHPEAVTGARRTRAARLAAVIAAAAVSPEDGKKFRGKDCVMMKRIVAFVFLQLVAASAFAGIYTPQSVPNPKQWGQEYYVSNPDGILSQATVDSLNYLARSLEEASGVEMAVVVLGSFRLTEEEQPNTCDLFQFNYELFNLWGIGNAETNRGLLVTVSYDDHQMFISTGTSLDADLPDATCLYIQNKFMLPRFREDDYDRGVMDGALAIYGYLTDDDMKSSIDKASSESSDDNDPFSVILGLIVLAGVIFLRRKVFRGGGGGYSGGGSWGGSSGSSHGSWGGGSTSGGGAGSRW